MAAKRIMANAGRENDRLRGLGGAPLLWALDEDGASPPRARLCRVVPVGTRLSKAKYQPTALSHVLYVAMYAVQ